MKSPIHGWINFNKPAGMSSAQAVGKVKWLLKPLKIGHAGTLDPFATGVLPLALGEATKLVPMLMDARKQYEFTLCFGIATDTDDNTGQTIATSDMMPTKEQVRAALPQFIGRISQRPPVYSAIKVNGERAYAMARAGETVTLAARQVEVDSLELLSMRGQEASLRMRCGKGTYVRAIARDLAENLGTCAHVTQLNRSEVGSFTQKAGISLDFLESLVHSAPPLKPEVFAEFLRPVSSVLEGIPAVAVTVREARQLLHGRAIKAEAGAAGESIPLTYNGMLVALCDASGGQWVPKRGFNLIPSGDVPDDDYCRTQTGTD